MQNIVVVGKLFGDIDKLLYHISEMKVGAEGWRSDAIHIKKIFEILIKNR